MTERARRVSVPPKSSLVRVQTSETVISSQYRGWGPMLNKLAREQILRRFTRGAFGLIASLWLLFSATPALAQAACMPVARIISALGDVSVGAAPGVQAVSVPA